VLRAACLLSDGPQLTPDMLDRLLESRREARAQAAPPRLAPRHHAILQAVGDRWASAAEVATALGASLAPSTVRSPICSTRPPSQRTGRASRYRCAHGWWRDLARFTPQQPARSDSPHLPQPPLGCNRLHRKALWISIHTPPWRHARSVRSSCGGARDKGGSRADRLVPALFALARSGWPYSPTRRSPSLSWGRRQLSFPRTPTSAGRARASAVRPERLRGLSAGPGSSGRL
jgi:hypothetical protein